MRDFRIHILLAVFLLCCREATAQRPLFEIPGYTVIHYTDENGLPQNSVKSICSDSSGYIWLATESGLVRYDGKHLRLFAPGETINDNSRIRYIGKWPGSERLFTQTETDHFIELFTGVRKQVFYGPPPYFNDSLFRSVYGKPIHSNLFYYHNRFGMLGENDVDLLVHVDRDSFYIVSSDHVTFGSTRKIIWETDIPATPQMLLYWQGKKLYRHRPDGVFFEITEKGQQPGFVIPGFKKMIWNEPENQTFILTEDQTLNLLKTGPDGQLFLFPLVRNLSPNFEIISAYYMPKERILMLGGAKQGLLVYKKQDFMTVGGNLPGYNSLYYAVMPYDSQSVVTGERNVVHADGKITPMPSPARDETWPGTISRRKDGRLVLCDDHYIHLYSDEGVLLKKNTFDDRISCVYTDRLDRTWFTGAYGGSLNTLDDNLVHKQVKGIGRLPHVYCLRDLNDDLLLIGTQKGLYTYSRTTGKLLYINRTAKYVIRDIFISVYGHIYLNTYGQGIIAVSRDGFSRLPVDPGKNLNMAHCMLKDRLGRLWISSNKGLFQIREFDIHQYLENKRQFLYYRHWLSDAGFSSNEFNGGCQPCAARLTSGKMVFPSMNGLVFFNPETNYAYQPPKTLDIEKMTVDEKAVYPIPDTLVLERAFKRFEIELAAPFFSAEEMPQFEYTPDTNRAGSWAPVGPEGKISFTSTESGYSYVAFRQHRVNGLGSYNYHTLTIYKPKAFWELPVFWFVCLVALISLILVAIRLRTRTLKQRNDHLAESIRQAREELLVTINSLTEATQKLEQKTRFQRWLTSSLVHDLRGPLRFINFYDGSIKKDSEITPEQNKFLKSVYFSVLKIYTYSENLVQLLRVEQTMDFPPEKTDFISLAEEKIEQFREQAKWNHTRIVLDSDSDPFILVNRAALSIIVQNLLDNSVKNSKNGNIYISLSNADGQSRILIRDEGPGIPTDILARFNRPFRNEPAHEQDMGIGLWLVKSLMAQTKGEIRFENTEPQGLLISLTWPLDITD